MSNVTDIQTPRKRVLAPATPSPNKKRRVEEPETVAAEALLRPAVLPPANLPPPSTLLASLGSYASNKTINTDAHAYEADKQQLSRDPDTLTIIEQLLMGPYEHQRIESDPDFLLLEPHSGIRLLRREMTHDDFSDFLRGRYYISPSKLYSVVRLASNRQKYEVPVEGEWVTIAVVASRGEIRLSQGTQMSTSVDEDDSGARKMRPKKHMTLKLVDFGSKSSSGSIKGDALLNLLLFEADSVTTSRETSSRKVDRTYTGGSGGAFEESSKLSEGAVIAICNPRVLKPFQVGRGGNGHPHPINNILAVTPTNAASIVVIGTARDLGKCSAMARDGNPCGDWFDKRIVTACDFHVQRAVQSRRAGRAEFSVGTTGIITESTGKHKKSQDFDPSRKWGLLPAGAQSVPKESQNLRGDTGAMYIVGGHVVNPVRGGDEFVAEKLGRGREERTKRIQDKAREDKMLNELLTRDGGLSSGAKALSQIIKPKSDPHASGSNVKSAFSAETIKRLGFDPAASKRIETESEVDRKLAILDAVRKPAGKVSLRKPPKPPIAAIRDKEPTPPSNSPIEDSSDLEFED